MILHYSRPNSKRAAPAELVSVERMIVDWTLLIPNHGLHRSQKKNHESHELHEYESKPRMTRITRMSPGNVDSGLEGGSVLHFLFFKSRPQSERITK